MSDLGWKDAVLVWSGGTVRIAMVLTRDFPGSQTYLFHGHNLEDEGRGTMSICGCERESITHRLKPRKTQHANTFI